MRPQLQPSNQPLLVLHRCDIADCVLFYNKHHLLIGDYGPRKLSLQKSSLPPSFKHLPAFPCPFPSSGKTSDFHKPMETGLLHQLTYNTKPDCLVWCAQSFYDHSKLDNLWPFNRQRPIVFRIHKWSWYSFSSLRATTKQPSQTFIAPHTLL